MGKNKKKGTNKGVPYHGQRPHAQGKRPGPLFCFKFNLKNAIKRAFPSLSHNKSETNKRCRLRIECLMDFLAFDVNQLLIYENQRKKCKNLSLTQQLRVMKFKVEELKTMSCENFCLLRAEEMLTRRAHLKCTSRSFRRQLIEFMADVEQTSVRSKIICEIMRLLDATDMDIAGLCKSVKEMPKALTCDIQTAADYTTVKRKDCGDVKPLCPEICQEVMRPYDPTIDEDAQSIHLRYIPALDSFKAHMARNPCALRLPLMCPPMKRIMNKMKTAYLMDDIPCKLTDQPSPQLTCFPIINCFKVKNEPVHENFLEEDNDTGTDILFKEEKFASPASSEDLTKRMNGDEINVYSIKDIAKLWLTTIKQLKEMYS